MRPYGLVLTAFLLAGLPAGAQQPPAAPPPAQAAAALDRHLLRWEQEMQKVQSLSAQLKRIDHDKTFDTRRTFVGFTQYMKAGTGPSALNLAVLQMTEEGKTEIHEKFVCTGTFVYRFVPSQKEIQYQEVPRPRPGQAADDNVLSFLLGMKMEEAKRRYDLKLAKEDQYYVYVDVLPRLPRDKADFQRARIVLNKDSFLPRQLWFEQPNGSDVTWDVPRVDPNTRLNRTEFDAPRTPPGWKLIQVRAEADPPPRVIRPSP